MGLWIAGAAGLVGLIGLVLYYAKKAERKDVKLEIREDLLDVIKESQDIRNDVANLSDDDINKLL